MKIFKKIYLLTIPVWPYWVSVAVAGLSLVAASRGPSPAAMLGLLRAAVYAGAERRLWARGFSHCGMWAQPPHSLWNLPGPGIKPVSPALSEGLLTSGAPGRLLSIHFKRPY